MSAKCPTGPWLWRHLKTAIGIFAGDRLIATICPGYSDKRAIASLIAAAPDLLGNLENILARYEAVHGIGDVEMQPAIYSARAAIAKAKAES